MTPSPLGVFWLEEAADKILKLTAVLWMCRERLGSLGADGYGVRSAADRSSGERVQESAHNLCRCLVFRVRFWRTMESHCVSAAVATDGVCSHISTKYYPYK